MVGRALVRSSLFATRGFSAAMPKSCVQRSRFQQKLCAPIAGSILR